MASNRFYENVVGDIESIQHFDADSHFVDVVATGCTSSYKEPAAIPQNTASLTPIQVVTDYYESLARGDMKDAKRFMSTKLINFYRSTADGGLSNIRSISHIRVSPPHNMTQDSSKVQVVANFDARYYQVGGTTNGPQTRFLYLVRSNENRPWLIEFIGTGP